MAICGCGLIVPIYKWQSCGILGGNVLGAVFVYRNNYLILSTAKAVVSRSLYDLFAISKGYIIKLHKRTYRVIEYS